MVGEGMDFKMISAPAEMRYKFEQITTPCPTEDMVKVFYSAFDELQLSLSEKEILHPSEERHRQKWFISQSKIFDFVNSYHVFCRLCKKHFYSRSVPTDINSFFQKHINSEYHREFRDMQFSRGKDMLIWEKKWITGKCNVCQMSDLCAFVRDTNCGPKKLLDQHCCIGNLNLQENSQELMRKISLLKKYCELSIFRDKFIKPLDEGNVCLLCSTKIPFSGENVKIHLGSTKHMNRFFWLVWKHHNLFPKDLLNGFNLEMIMSWFYNSTVKFPEELESAYEKYRLECCAVSSATVDFEYSASSGHYCPEVIEKLLAFQPSDFTRDTMCLLCDQPIFDAHYLNNFHFNSECHKSKLANLSEEFFRSWNHYEDFCANRNNRLQVHINTIEKYKQLKEGKSLYSLKVGVKNNEQTYVKKLFSQKLLLVKKPPLQFVDEYYKCEVCDLRVLSSLAISHATEFRHLYYCKKWQEVEKSAADSRFFEPFQRVKNHIVCLLCGEFAQSFNFFHHLKSTLHTKRFEWYCSLKNDVPISSAIEVRPDMSVVCYLCDNLLLKSVSKKKFKINLKSIQKHWPCLLVDKEGRDTKESLNASKDIERTCPTCGDDRGAHKSDCATNSLNWNRIENAVKGILNACEGAIVERVLDRTKSTIRDIQAAIVADLKQRQESTHECDQPRSRFNGGNVNNNFNDFTERFEKRYQKIERNLLKNDKTDDKKSEKEDEEEILVISGLPLLGSRKFQKLVTKLMTFGKIQTLHYEGTSAKVVFAEKGVANKVATDVKLFPQKDGLVTMTVNPRKVFEEKSKKSDDAVPESLKKHALKAKFPPMSSDLLELLEEPHKLAEFVENLTAAVTAASGSVEELEREKLVCATINAAVVELFPQCRCYPFGSRLSGLMFSNSDLDVFLDCGGICEGTENMSSHAERVLIHKIAMALRKKREICHLIIIDRARVPIISFFHKPANLHCDLSFKNALSVHNTLLIKFLMSLDRRVKFVIVFLKYWVKQSGIHGPPYFSSYAITMMVIFYLQQLKPPMIPTVEELQNAFVGRRFTIGGWDCSFSENMEGLLKNKGDYSFHDLLQGFFSYFANFEYGKFAISPLDGKPLPREAFFSDGEVKLPMCYKRHILNFPQPLETLVCQRIPICVIDPFDLSHVLTKSFTPIGLQVFKFYCELSAEALKRGALHSLISNEGSKIDF